MKQRKRVLGPLNGNLNSTVVFVAEAPGRLGADKYGIPLFGDQTGRNFDYFISSVGITRDSIFITNAILCNPRELSGNNGSPSMTEIRNCSTFLEDTIKIIQPRFIVTLGSKALVSLNVIQPHEIKLSEGVGHLFPWGQYSVFPLFHPGPRAFIWRTKSKQYEDYKTLITCIKDNEI